VTNRERATHRSSLRGSHRWTRCPSGCRSVSAPAWRTSAAGAFVVRSDK